MPEHAPSAEQSPDHAFPPAGIDAFLSHFIVAIKITSGERSGALVTFSLPAAVQTVARSKPFVLSAGASSRVTFPIPRGCTLPESIEHKDFFSSPPGFFEKGREQIWLQILNLDARGETPVGPVRVILGETFKREYPDLFEPSFGAAQSIGRTGLPARLFFSPNGVFETPIGALKTQAAKTLLGDSVDRIPPVGSAPRLLQPCPLYHVDALRAAAKGKTPEPAAIIVALAHPIDAELIDPQGSHEAFASIERSIASS